MPLDPFLKEKILEMEIYPKVHQVPLSKLRGGAEKLFKSGLPLEKIYSTEDFSISILDKKIQARLYRPTQKTHTPQSIIIFIHGGGFVFCGIESHDELCRHLCKESESLVLSIDYSLAPENKYPIALNECIGTVDWVKKNAHLIGADINNIALAGDSAGGNLAASVCLSLPKGGQGRLIKALLLMYPVTDHYSSHHPSYDERGKGFGLTSDEMTWFWDSYIDPSNPELVKNHKISPLRANSLSDFPPTFIITAEYDLLRDEGIVFAKRLIDEGIPTKWIHATDANHGFLFWIGKVKTATDAIKKIGLWFKEVLK